MPTGPPTFVFSHPLCRATQRSIVAPFTLPSTMPLPELVDSPGTPELSYAHE